MNKLVFIFLQNEFVIGQVVLKLLIKRLAVAMVHMAVDTSAYGAYVYIRLHLHILLRLRADIYKVVLATLAAVEWPSSASRIHGVKISTVAGGPCSHCNDVQRG
jgi:hypothetical protein